MTIKIMAAQRLLAYESLMVAGEFINTIIDKELQKLYTTKKMDPKAEILRTYKKGFRAGFAKRGADDSGVKPEHKDILKKGENAGYKARKEFTGEVPAMFKQTPSGTNKPNPAFDKIVNQFFKPLED